MKYTVIIIANILLLANLSAQSRFSAQSYLAAPEKYLGKSVTVNVGSVVVPAINCTTSDNFRVFLIYTMGRNGNTYIDGGSIYVKVPLSDAEGFVRRHNNLNKMGPANLSGKFMEWPTTYSDRTLGLNPTQEMVWSSRCYSYSHFYLDLMK
jgi:hypothetical protein